MRINKEKNKDGQKRSVKPKAILADAYVARLWANLREPSTALSSLTQFARSRKNDVNIKELSRSLSKIKAYSMHKRTKRHIRRPSYIIHSMRMSFCSDLGDVSEFASQNASTTFLLFSLDQFTKKLSVVPLRTKSAKHVVVAMKIAIKELRAKPNATWIVDGGKEFANGLVQNLMKQHKINMYVSVTNNKAAFCERQIQSYKSNLYKYMSLNNTKKYLSALPLLTNLHNNKINLKTGLSPNQITSRNEDETFAKMYAKLALTPRPPPVYKIGDRIRISSRRLQFHKAYKPGFSDKVFIVKEVLDTRPIYSYKLMTESGIELASSYVSDEMSESN